MENAERPTRFERLRDASGFGLAYGFSIGIVSLWFAFERGPKSWACMATALGLAVFALVAHRIKGAGAARAAGVAFLPTLGLWLLAALGSSWRGPVVAGLPNWICDHASMASYGPGLFWVFLSGFVAMVSYYWTIDRSPRSAADLPRLHLVWLGAGVTSLLTAWGALALSLRPSVEAFRDSIVFERALEVPSGTERGATVFDAPTLTISMSTDTPDEPLFDLHDGFGKRSTNRKLFAGDHLALFHDPDRRVWVAHIVGEEPVESDPLAFARYSQPRFPREHDVHLRDVPGAIGPPLEAVVAPLSGALVLVAFGLYASRRRRATRRILDGTEGHWDGSDHVEVAGTAHRLDVPAEGSSLVPGPVIASKMEMRSGYRTTPSLDALFLVSGTRAQHAARFRSMLHEWQPFVLVLAALLALPLLGAASLGCM